MSEGILLLGRHLARNRDGTNVPLKSETAMQLDDLKQFRQWGSKTPGHPENFETKGIEVTTGEAAADLGHACNISRGPWHGQGSHVWPLGIAYIV